MLLYPSRVQWGTPGDGSPGDGKYNAHGDAGEKNLERPHVAVADALRGPGAVMIHLLAAIVTKLAMLRKYALSPDHFAVFAELSRADW